MNFKVKKMQNRIRIACPDCRKHFSELRHINQHFTKSGHNESKHYSISDVIQLCSSIKFSKNKVSVTLPL